MIFWKGCEQVQSEKEKNKFLKYIENFRKKYVPNRYNQVKLADHLLNENIDHYVSISNRSDGKSYNYMHFFIRLAIDYDIRFCFVVRHHTVQMSGVKLIEKIIDTQDFNPFDFQFTRTDFYIIVIYRDREIGVITDLNKATDLKYQSNYLEYFPVIVYDEFLALEDDYLPDEWEKLETIYSSIDRVHNRPYIKIPKIFYLGNAVNFSSPILANLDMFNILEKHKMNTLNIYDNIAIEVNRNDNANEQRNLRAFKDTGDKLSKAEFQVNNYNVATKKDRQHINNNPNYIHVKLRDNYLKIIYNRDSKKAILSIVSHANDYEFNLLVKDNKKESIFLNETFYDIEYSRKYEKNIYLFDNNFSKNFITDGLSMYKDIRIHKIINMHSIKFLKNNHDMKELVYKENYIENTKKMLANRFLL